MYSIIQAKNFSCVEKVCQVHYLGKNIVKIRKKKKKSSVEVDLCGSSPIIIIIIIKYLRFNAYVVLVCEVVSKNHYGEFVMTEEYSHNLFNSCYRAQSLAQIA